MSLSSACAESIQRDVGLAERTWFGLGGSARYFCVPNSRDQLIDVLRWASEQELAVRVLGRGANVLVSDGGFDGLVIRLEHDVFSQSTYQGTRVRVGGGANLMIVARDCAKRGLSGLERLAGIPATVGGAVAMNAGGRYGEISDVIESVELMDRDGVVRHVAADAMGFGYRHSDVGDRIVLSAALRLTDAPADEVVDRFQAIWREKSQSQPFAEHCAGCMFKNPPGHSAGKLIDDAGLKGSSVGKARVSRRHANFILADRGATAADVLALADRVRDEIFARTGLKLEREIDVW